MAHREIERSYQPAVDADLPDPTRLPGVARVAWPATVGLHAVYFDTPDSALLRAGVTLRRRSGGDDDGWHLEVPAGKGRDEVRLPLSRARRIPPKPLRDAVLGWTRGAGLVPVAALTTRRTSLDLLDDDGAVLAQLADDLVEGQSLIEESEPVTWREWELELVDGRPGLLEAADELFATAGMQPAPSRVELERVLGPPMPPHPPLRRPKKRRPAHLVLHTRIAEQVAELGRRDSQVRRGEPEGVHKARVACRRLRGALATYRPLVDREVTDPIRTELRWVAHVLGDARDLDVAYTRLRGLVDEQPGRLVVGPVRRRLARSYTARRKQAYAQARSAIDSERYYALRAELDRLAAAPPWTEQAAAEARDVLPSRVRKELARVRKRVSRARATADATERDAATHAARRAAKRLRYAAEALQPVWGKDAAALAKTANRLVSALGVRQDAVVTRGDLLELAEAASTAGENPFTYGLLHAEERRLADDVDDRLDELWGRVAGRGDRDWL